MKLRFAELVPDTIYKNIHAWDDQLFKRVRKSLYTTNFKDDGKWYRTAVPRQAVFIDKSETRPRRTRRG